MPIHLEPPVAKEPAWRDRCFCQWFLIATISWFLGIAVTNFCVNPFGQYAPTQFRPMVQTSRAEKVHLLANVKTIPEGLILGSSRVLKLEPDYLERRTGLRFFNAGINHGKTEDFLAFLRYYQETFAHSPKMVVLGLDVNAFTNGSPPDARLLSNTALASQVPEAITLSGRLRRWCDLLSWQQTKSTLNSLVLHVSSESAPVPVESFRNDGLIVYHQRERELTEGAYDFEPALEYNKREFNRLFRAFTTMSQNRSKFFETFATMCQDNDIQLTVFLTPVHPRLAEHLKTCAAYANRKSEVTQFLEEQSVLHRFAFRDLSSIDSFGGDPMKFVDGIHALEPNTRRVIDQILSPQPSASDYVVQ